MNTHTHTNTAFVASDTIFSDTIIQNFANPLFNPPQKQDIPMEQTLFTFTEFKTDVGHSIGQKGPFYNKTLNEMLKMAETLNANVICKTTTGSWYIKNISLKIPYINILNSLKKNESENFKKKCLTWLIKNNT